MPRTPPPLGPEAAVGTNAMEGLIKSESAEWVELVITMLEGEGRYIEGGWPGTVSEARRRLTACLVVHPQEAPLDSGEVTVLVDRLYSQAKQLWLRECPGRTDR